MGLFTRSKRNEVTPSLPRSGSGIAKLGVGRRVRCAQDIGSTRLVLAEILESYGPRQYPELPRLVTAGWEWFGSPAQQPAVVVSGAMHDGHPGFVTLRSTAEGTEAGIYDLAGEMTLPLIGHWKQQDASLTSIGQVEAGLAIAAPPVPDNFIEELVQRLGLEPSEENWRTAAAQLRQMFVLKAITYMQKEPEVVTHRFIDDHRSVPLGVEGLFMILNDLARWRTGIVPYIQDIPPRIRAFVLQAGRLNDPG